ncbi:MAG: hypothetical protein ACLFTZ_01835 [Acholeplasmataceae bacterium]
MKTRIAIAGSLTLFILIFLPIALVLADIQSQRFFLILSILLLVYLGIYVFGGVAKLIVYFIYGLIMFLTLSLLPEGYHLPFILFGTLLFVLNPLANLESYLESKLRDEDVLPIRISLYGSYWPFYSYRREMKNYYHLPQARKLYTKSWYLYLRQATTVFLVSLGIFLFIHEINNIANSIDNFNLGNFFVLYIVIMVFILAFFSFKKGFTSTYRLLVIAMFPAFIYIVSISDLGLVLKLVFAGTLFVLGVIVAIVEIIKFYHRVAYDAYHYYDVDQQKEVFANALFEPLVYNETFTLCAEYRIKVTLETFQKHFHRILVYANFFRFIITAYAYGQETIYLHADFHYNNGKRAHLFKTYLESMFKAAVPLDLRSDPNKEIYERKFFHRPPYIIARAQHLAELLKELEIDSKIVISMIMYFESEENLRDFEEDYPVMRLDQIETENTFAVRVDIPAPNLDYVIETKIREVLLSMMINEGRFVRITVYY